MKRYRLKKKVKNTLIAIGVIGVFVLSAIILDKHYRNAIESCVAGGNPRTFCENVLR
jgi:hypothetical protein